MWGLFLAVASYVALNSFSKTQRKRRGGEEVAMQYLGPVESELKWIRLASYGSYGRWRLAQRLAGLLAKALAQHYRMTEAEAKRALQAGRWEVPPEIRAYVLMGLGTPESRPPIIRLLRPRSRPQGAPHTSDPNAVMDFIEAKLEELYVR